MMGRMKKGDKRYSNSEGEDEEHCYVKAECTVGTKAFLRVWKVSLRD